MTIALRIVRVCIAFSSKISTEVLGWVKKLVTGSCTINKVKK